MTTEEEILEQLKFLVEFLISIYVPETEQTNFKQRIGNKVGLNKPTE